MWFWSIYMMRVSPTRFIFHVPQHRRAHFSIYQELAVCLFWFYLAKKKTKYPLQSWTQLKSDNVIKIINISLTFFGPSTRVSVTLYSSYVFHANSWACVDVSDWKVGFRYRMCVYWIEFGYALAAHDFKTTKIGIKERPKAVNKSLIQMLHINIVVAQQFFVLFFICL